MENIYNERKQIFISKHGQSEFDKLYGQILGTKQLHHIEQWIMQHRMFPNAQDFNTVASSTTSLFLKSIFRSTDSSFAEMGSLIALKLMNDRVNESYHFECPDRIKQLPLQIIRINYG